MIAALLREAKHEKIPPSPSNGSAVHAVCNDSEPARAAADRPGCATNHHLRVGWASSRRPNSRYCAQLLCASAIRRGVYRPPCGLSDLYDDEFRFHRHWHLSGGARVLRQRGVCSLREGKECEREA